MRMRHAICLFIATTLSLCDSLPARAAELNEAALSANKAPPGAIWLDSLGVSYIEQEWGQPRKRRSVERHPLTIGGKVFRHGVGTHAASEMRIDLKGAAEQFVSFVGVDDETAKKGSVTFEVWVDGKQGGRERPYGRRRRPQTHRRRSSRRQADDAVGRRRRRRHRLRSRRLGRRRDRARPRRGRQATERLLLEVAATVPAIIHSDSPQPAIHGPRIVGSTPGHAFNFLVPATGEKPLIFAASNLPEGLTLDAETGIISRLAQATGQRPKSSSR